MKLCRVLLVAAACSVWAVPRTIAHEKPAPETPRILSAEQWREDLRHLASELPRTHRNAFHAITREQWEAAVNRLDERLPRLRRDQIIVELSKLVARIGDGHTCFGSFYVPAVGFRRYPVSFYEFADGLYVRATDPRYAKVAGGRVVRLGRAAANEALAAAAAVDGRDNPMWSKLTAPWRLETAEVVHGLGLTDDVERTPLVVEKDGALITVELTPEQVPEAERNTSVLPAGWIDARGERRLLWQQDRGSNFWKEYLPERRALYVQFNSVQDAPGQTLEQFFNGVFEFVDSHEVERLVLDMRNNGGGNNYLSPPIVKGIMRNPKLNSRGKVYVLIGRHTFSAAQNTVNWLKKWTDAIFVGEPTGSSPNQFADAVPVRLPNSGLSPQVATVWWQDIDERIQDPWVVPDIAVDMTGQDYRRGHDPVLEAALSDSVEPPLAEQMRTALAGAKGVEEMLRIARAYRDDPRHRYASFESAVNLLGYDLMGQKKLDAALAVMEFNVESSPLSWNAWDSLAEVRMNRGETSAAIAAYEKSLALNSKNTNALAMLAKLRGN